MLSKLEEMLSRYMGAYPAFRIKPIGAEGSAARIEQENLMRLEEEARALLSNVRDWRENRDGETGFSLHDMTIGQRIALGSADDGFPWCVTRVPGGWIYTAVTAEAPCSVFVPYSDEGALPF